MRQLIYQVCYTRYQVSFYLWLIGSVLKYCKVPKYNGQDCRIPGNPNANPPAQEVQAIQTTATTFQINHAKLFVPIVTLSINDNINFLENIKQGFNRTVSWNKYRSEIAAQNKNQQFRFSD